MITDFSDVLNDDFERASFNPVFSEMNVDGFKQSAFNRQRAEVLSSVFLYDEDEEARAKVDDDDFGAVFAAPNMRADESLHVLGRELALTVDTDLADMPMDLAERAIERVADEGRRNGYRERLAQLGANGGDTAQDYYRLYAQVQRDNVQIPYREHVAKVEERKAGLTGLFAELVAARGFKAPEAWTKFYDGQARGVYTAEDEDSIRRAADAWSMMHGMVKDYADASANVLAHGSTGELIFNRLYGDELAEALFFAQLQTHIQDMKTSAEDRNFFVRFAQAFEAADKTLMVGMLGGHFKAYVTDAQVDDYNKELERAREISGLERPNVELLAEGDNWVEKYLSIGNARLGAVHAAARQSGQLNKDGSLRKMTEEERRSTQELNEFRGQLFNATEGLYDIDGLAAKFGKMLPDSMIYLVPGGMFASAGSMYTRELAQRLGEGESWTEASNQAVVNSAIQATVEKIAFGSLKAGRMVPGMDWLMSRQFMARSLGGFYSTTGGRIAMGMGLGTVEETFAEPLAALVLGGAYNTVASKAMQLDNPYDTFVNEMEEMLSPDQFMATALYSLLLMGGSYRGQKAAAENYRQVRDKLMAIGVDEGRAAQVARMDDPAEQMSAELKLINERLRVDARGVLSYVAELYPQLQPLATVENYFDKGLLPRVLPAGDGQVKVQEKDENGEVTETIMSEATARLLVESRLEELQGEELAEMADMVLANAMVGSLSKDGGRWVVSLESEKMNHEYFQRLARAAGLRLSEGARPEDVDPEVHPHIPLGLLAQQGKAWESRMKVARHDYEQKLGHPVSDEEWARVSETYGSRVNRTGVRGADKRLRTVLRVARGGFGAMDVLEDVTEDNLVRDMVENGRTLDYYITNLRELEGALGKPGAFLRELKDGETEGDRRMAVIEAMGKLVQSKVLADTAKSGNKLSAALNAFLDLIRSWVLQAKAMFKLGEAVNTVLTNPEAAAKMDKEFREDVERLVAQDVEFLQGLQLADGLEAMQRVYEAHDKAKADRKVKRRKRAKSPVVDEAMEKHGEEVRKEQAEKEKTQAEVQADVEAAEAVVDGDFTSSSVNEEEPFRARTGSEKFAPDAKGKEPVLSVNVHAMLENGSKATKNDLITDESGNVFWGRLPELDELKNKGYAGLNLILRLGYKNDGFNHIVNLHGQWIMDAMGIDDPLIACKRFISTVLQSVKKINYITNGARDSLIVKSGEAQRYFIVTIGKDRVDSRYAAIKTAFVASSAGRYDSDITIFGGEDALELRIPMSSFGENQRFRATSERQDRSSDYPDTAATSPSKGMMPEVGNVVKHEELISYKNNRNGGDFSASVDEPVEPDISFSVRTKAEPKKKGIGYKVFYQKDGKLYPPMVANPGGEDTPVGVWLDADEGVRAGESKTGRPQVKAGGKGTQGGSGTLAYRPGWHLGKIPYALQFNRKNPVTGERDLFPKDFVWAEVEYAADVDYQEEAMSYGVNKNGKFQHSLAGLPKLPTDGYYEYRTNPNPATDPWIITGAMKVKKVLTRAEVDELVRAAGREPQKVEGDDMSISATEGNDYAAPWEVGVDASFNVVGPSAANWDKIKHRAFRGRDDGKERVEIDASGAKLLIGVNDDELAVNVEDFLGEVDRFVAELPAEERALLDAYVAVEQADYEDLDEYDRDLEATQGAAVEVVQKLHDHFKGEVDEFILWQTLPGMKNRNAYARLTWRKEPKEDIHTNLGEVLHFPELYESYPHLRNFEVEFVSLGIAHGRAWSWKIEINKKLLVGRQEEVHSTVLSTVLHEVQHVIQRIEGYANGGSPRFATMLRDRVLAGREKYEEKLGDLALLNRLPEIQERYEWLINKWESELQMLSALHNFGEGHDEAKKLVAELETYAEGINELLGVEEKHSDNLYGTIEGLWIDSFVFDIGSTQTLDYLRENYEMVFNSDNLNELKEYRKKTEAELGAVDAQNMRALENMGQSEDAYELYRRLAGEIEARNVQERMGWSAEEREAKPFNETLEYPDEALVSFNVIGPSAKTWDKYEDSRKFRGRDDGKERVEIDASGAKLTPRAFLGEAGDEYRLLVAGKAMPFGVQDDLEKLREQQKLIDGWYHILFETDDVDKAQEYSHEHGMTQEWWAVNTALLKNVKEFVARQLQLAGVTGEGKYGGLIGSNSRLMGKIMESLIAGKVDEDVAAELDRMSYGDMKCLKDILDYEELYEAYPDLKWLPVSVADLGYQLRGQLTVKGDYPDSIMLNERLDNEGRRSTLLHEIQHAIQTIEEFARGGTAEMASKLLEKQVRQYRIRLEHLRHEQRWLYAVDTAKDHLQRMLRLLKRPRAILKMGERFAVHEMQHVPTMAAQAIEMMWKEYTEIAMRDYGDSVAYAPGDGYRLPGHGDKKPTLVAVEELLEKVKALPSRRAGTLRGRRQKVEADIERLYEENKHKLNMTDMSGSELYLRLAGEIEARNVQERRDWTMAERMARPFNETLEYPGEALVSFSVSPTLGADIARARKRAKNADGTISQDGEMSRNAEVELCTMPDFMRFLGEPDVPVVARVFTLRKLLTDHKLTDALTYEVVQKMNEPVLAIQETPSKLLLLLDMESENKIGNVTPVVAIIEHKQDKEGNRYLVSAYPFEDDKETKVTNQFNKLVYCKYSTTAKFTANAPQGRAYDLLRAAISGGHTQNVPCQEDVVKWKQQKSDFTSSVVNLDERALAYEVVAAGQGFRANLAFSEQIVREMRGALLRMKKLGSKTRTEREDAIAAMGTMVQVVKAAVAYLPQGYRFSVHPYLNKIEVLAELATTGDLKMTKDLANKTIKEWLKLNQGIDEVVAVKGQELDRQTSAAELAKEYGEMQLQEAMEAIMHRVAGQLRKHAKDRAVLKIKELVERLAPKKDPKTGKLKGGKMSADAYRDLEDVAKAMNMDAEELEAKLAALRAEMEKPGIDEERRAQLESEMTLYDQFGDLKSMTAEEAVEALEALRQRVWFHRFEWDNVQAERRAARRAMVRSVVDGVGAVSENEYNAKKRAVKPTKRLKHLGDILSGMPAVLTGLRGYLPLHKLADNLALRANRAGEAIKKWEAERWVALEALSRETLGKSWRKCMDFMHEVLPTGVTFDRPKYRSVSVKTAALRELLAMTKEERRAEMNRRRDAGGLEAESVLTERDVEELSKALSAMEEAGKVLSTVEARYVASVQREENLQLSRGEALYAILMYEQPRYTERMEAQGYTPEVIVGLKRFIGEGMLQFGYGLRELFALQGERIARVYEATFGVPFPREENYFAARWNVTGMKENPAEQLLAGMAGTPGAANGWMKQRVDHNLELDMTKDALQVFLQATTLTDTWMATQDIVADFKAWSRDPDFDRAMVAALGKDGYENLKDWIRIVELGGVQDCLNMGVSQDVINGLYGSGAVAILGFRIQTWLRQLPSIFNGLLGAHDISVGEWLATLSRMRNAEAPMTYKRMMKSTLIQNRRPGKAGNMAGQAMRSNDTASSMTEGVLLWSMLPMEIIDASCTAMSLVPVWNVYYQRAIDKGASVQEAEQAAWEQTTIVANLSAQPIGWLNKSKIAQSRNPLVKAVFFMLSENTAKFAMCRALWRGGKKKAALRAWLLYGAANATISALLDALQGDPEEFEKGKWWEYVLSALYGPLASIPGVGEMVEALGTLVLNATGHALDVEELKKAKTHASVGRAMLDVQGFIKAWTKIYGYMTDDEEHSLAEYTRAASTISRTMAIGTGWMSNALGYWSTVVAVLMNPIDFGARVWRNMKHYFD